MRWLRGWFARRAEPKLDLTNDPMAVDDPFEYRLRYTSMGDDVRSWENDQRLGGHGIENEAADE